MDKPHSKRKDIFLVGLFVVLVLLLIWVFTAEGPEGDYYAFVFGYGNTITMEDRAAAEACANEYHLTALKVPGVYLMNKEGELVAPLQGGLKMTFKGLTGGDGRQSGSWVERSTNRSEG